MSFKQEWTDELSKKLNQEYVKQRKQGKSNLSYIEAHHVIREANEIFGYGEWSYTLDKLEMVEKEVKVSKSGSGENFYVSYNAIITLTVNGTSRTDVGFGQGIDRDAGKAHEGATKEAVSDGLKRCLRTFGDRFGLALYDKELKNIAPCDQSESYRSATEKLLSLAKDGKQQECSTFAKQMLAEKVIERNDPILAECKKLFGDVEAAA